MKKRLFAGALALLMIIGLLPVSSMLKKPIEAKAYGTVYTFNPATISVDSNKCPQTVETVFAFDSAKCTTKQLTATLKDGDTNISDPTVLRFGGAAKYINNIPTNRYIKIKVSNNANLTLKWASGQTSRGVKVVKKNNNDAGEDIYTATATTDSDKNKIVTKEIKLDANVEYYVAPSAGDIYIYSMVVTETSTEESAEGYTVTVVDSANSETPKTSTIAEGNNITYTAQGTNFAYWLNSNGVKVSTSEKLDMPVYYSDTYTAVYAKDGAKVDYLTPYGGILETHYADEDFTAPDVPARYGYTVDGWDKNIDTVKKSLKEGTSVTVNPQYKDNAGLRYTITIDATDFDGTKNTQEYTVNTVVKASVTDTENFACWKVGDDVVSYNPTYYFFANRPVTVTAVKNDGSEVSKGAIITEVENSADNNTVIFEYTVPDEYEMTFAGVIASTNAESLASVKDDNITIPAGVYKLGADSTKCSNYNTYRYTLRKAGNDTWYVKPVLTYTDSTGSHTIYGNTVTMK